MAPYNNPWNEVYRLAAGNRKGQTQTTTLRKPDGTLTADLNETLQLMLHHFAPEDNLNADSFYGQQNNKYFTSQGTVPWQYNEV